MLINGFNNGSFQWLVYGTGKILVHVNWAVVVESGEVFLSFPPCFSDIHALVPRTDILCTICSICVWLRPLTCMLVTLGEDLKPSAAQIPNMSRRYIFLFTWCSQPISFSHLEVVPFIFLWKLLLPPVNLSFFFLKKPPCCIVVGMLFSEALYFT